MTVHLVDWRLPHCKSGEPSPQPAKSRMSLPAFYKKCISFYSLIFRQTFNLIFALVTDMVARTSQTPEIVFCPLESQVRQVENLQEKKNIMQKNFKTWFQKNCNRRYPTNNSHVCWFCKSKECGSHSNLTEVGASQLGLNLVQNHTNMVTCSHLKWGNCCWI